MKKKNYSYRDRSNYHTKRMLQGIDHSGKMNKKESYSAGFVKRDLDFETFNKTKPCDKAAFEKGARAGYKAFNKAMDYKF